MIIEILFKNVKYRLYKRQHEFRMKYEANSCDHLTLIESNFSLMRVINICSVASVIFAQVYN